MTRAGQLSDDFGNRHDAMHGGRIGNSVTINGQMPERIAVRSGERIRLRLINTANARIFGLDFGALEPVVVALDGQPVTPHVPDSNIVVIGPAMRVDLVIDMTGKPGEAVTVTDVFYEGLEYRLVDLVYGPDRLRDSVPDWSMDLPPNPLAEPDMASAARHQIVFNGGMMGQMMMGSCRDRSTPWGYAALSKGGVGLMKLAMLPGIGCFGASYFVRSDRSPFSTDVRTFSR